LDGRKRDVVGFGIVLLGGGRFDVASFIRPTTFKVQAMAHQRHSCSSAGRCGAALRSMAHLRIDTSHK
jgi:hypothetical protein